VRAGPCHLAEHRKMFTVKLEVKIDLAHVTAFLIALKAFFG
jgi:hypothetical protein